MRSIRFLILVPLILTSLLGVIAAPVPMPAPTLQTASHHPDHPHQPTTQVSHLPVTAHAVPNKDGHVMGHMPAHPDHKNGMTPAQLQDHAHHISTQLGGNHVVHAAHQPGDDHVHFHAIHKDHDQEWFPPDHAVHHPSHNPAEAPHRSLSYAESGKILTGLNRANTAGNVHHEFVHREGTGHGQGVVGTAPMHPDHVQSKTPAELHVHTQWVDQHLTGTQRGNSMIHTTHRDGSPTANFHATGLHGTNIAPIRPPTPDQPPHQHIAPLHPHEHTALTAHLQKTQNEGRHVLTPVPNGGSSFKGTIPAHHTGPMTPAHLDQYAQHAYNQLKNKPGVDHNNLVVAAVHKEGDHNVHIHTAPRGFDMFQRGRGQNQGAFPQFNEALHKAGHLVPNQQPPVTSHHAELGALGESMTARGATPATFNDHIGGHVIGVHGKHGGDAITQPCDNCHHTLAQFPVDYRGRDRRLPAGIKRGLTE